MEEPPLSATQADTTLVLATPPFTGKGPCLKRRYQEGLFKRENGHYYSFFRRDVEMPDGSTRSKLVRIKIGKIGSEKVGGMSELAARREHGRIREQINRERGSVPPAPRGESFRDIAELYMTNVAPHLSISTVRQRKSHLNHHLLPRFGNEVLMSRGRVRLAHCSGSQKHGIRSSSRRTVRIYWSTRPATLRPQEPIGIWQAAKPRPPAQCNIQPT